MICPTPGGEARTGDQHKSVGRRNPIRIRITDPLSCLGQPCGSRVPTDVPFKSSISPSTLYVTGRCPTAWRQLAAPVVCQGRPFFVSFTRRFSWSVPVREWRHSRGHDRLSTRGPTAWPVWRGTRLGKAAAAAADLLRELAGRSQNERLQRPAALVESIDERQSECECLARPRAGLPDDVPPL